MRDGKTPQKRGQGEKRRRQTGRSFLSSKNKSPPNVGSGTRTMPTTPSATVVVPLSPHLAAVLLSPFATSPPSHPSAHVMFLRDNAGRRGSCQGGDRPLRRPRCLLRQGHPQDAQRSSKGQGAAGGPLGSHFKHPRVRGRSSTHHSHLIVMQNSSCKYLCNT